MTQSCLRVASGSLRYRYEILWLFAVCCPSELFPVVFALSADIYVIGACGGRDSDDTAASILGNAGAAAL